MVGAALGGAGRLVRVVESDHGTVGGREWGGGGRERHVVVDRDGVRGSASGEWRARDKGCMGWWKGGSSGI